MASIDSVNLKIMKQCGDEDEQRIAAQLEPLISDHHYLLVTLLLFNSIANECLPIFLNKLLVEWAAVFVSVTLVLLFGEIIPSAMFSSKNK